MATPTHVPAMKLWAFPENDRHDMDRCPQRHERGDYALAGIPRRSGTSCSRACFDSSRSGLDPKSVGVTRCDLASRRRPQRRARASTRSCGRKLQRSGKVAVLSGTQSSSTTTRRSASPERSTQVPADACTHGPVGRALLGFAPASRSRVSSPGVPPIPSFSDGLLPPYLGASPGEQQGLMSPYKASSMELVAHFATSRERIAILGVTAPESKGLEAISGPQDHVLSCCPCRPRPRLRRDDAQEHLSDSMG